MSKLQRIKRTDGTESFSSNIPIAAIKDLDWKKGDTLLLETSEIVGRRVIVIYNDGADYGRD